ncbi:response regulator transcription factor [Microbacterium sp. NPDC057659]|uniref:response regulator transcription factor n=1 Tax=Microbacterium sp. NPDC057659 TaxID=3346198 RepID=UPI00366C126D
MRILIAEDDARLRSLLERALRESGYAVSSHADSDSALFEIETDASDLLVLDIMLPGSMDGVALCRRVRERDTATPILLLTALDAPAHRVAGLDSGADDYLTKPFHLSELLARVRALLRRAPLAVSPVLEVAGVSLDPASRTVTRDDRSIDLTAREFAVLELLMRNPGRVVSTSEFIDHAWDAHYDGYSNVVASTIRHLRGKLSSPGRPDPITTRRGSGYVLHAEGDPR